MHTSAEFVAAGWPADVARAGTYTWTFDQGRATIELDADDGSTAHCEADMALVQGHVRLTYAGFDCGDELDVITWDLAADGLHLFLISSNAPLDEQKAYLETKPWQPVESAKLHGSLVFGREDAPDRWQVWTSCADLSEPRQLTQGLGQQSGWPDFSPDGTRIAFNSDRDDPDLDDAVDVWDIYAMDVHGDDAIKLTASIGSSVDPDYSPNGEVIAFGWDAPGEEGIYVMDAADGGNVRRITMRPADAALDYSPHFSPDGSQLVFSRDLGQDGSALFVVNLDGSGLTRITPANVKAGEASWSPDGTQIAFDGELGNGMWLVAPDGTDLRNLDPAPAAAGIQHGFSDPIWALDGAVLLVQHGLHRDDGTVTVGMAVMTPDGSDLRYVGDGTGAEEKGDWSANAC